MNPADSSPCSEQSAIRSCSELFKSSSHPVIYAKWFPVPSLKVFLLIFRIHPCILHTYYMSTPSHRYWHNYRNDSLWSVNTPWSSLMKVFLPFFSSKISSYTWAVSKYHHHHPQGLDLLACSDLPVRRIDPSISSVVDLLSLLPLGW
jgi:hypothetical protein